jgi:hypothetical protein
MTDDRPKQPNWWKAGRRASFVLCVGEAPELDAWMEGPHGQSLARHLEKHTGWRLVKGEAMPGMESRPAGPGQGGRVK